VLTQGTAAGPSAQMFTNSQVSFGNCRGESGKVPSVNRDIPNPAGFSQRPEKDWCEQKYKLTFTELSV